MTAASIGCRDCRAGRAGARLFRLRFGADLHAADLGGVRAARRGADAAADRHDLHLAVHDPRHAAMQSGAKSPGVDRRLRLAAARRRGAGLCRCHPAALVHRRLGAGRAGHARRRLALSRPADECRLRSPSAPRRLWRRRGADRRAAALGLLARRRQQRGDRARQHHGLFPPQGALAIALITGGLFTGETIALSVLLGCRSRWRWPSALLVSRHPASALPPRRLRHHRVRRTGQPAAVRRAALKDYALIFCISASDTSKLA